MKRLWLFVLLSNLVTVPAWSQTCDTSKHPLAAPTERYKDNGDGTVTDLRLNMTWMRCSLGQEWNGATCTGEPEAFTWQQAQDEAAALNKKGGYGKYNDWRVPHIPEIAMIAEPQCSDPRINLTVFPATPAAFYWSATLGRGKREGAYMLSFGPEGADPSAMDAPHFVRLVRNDMRVEKK